MSALRLSSVSLKTDAANVVTGILLQVWLNNGILCDEAFFASIALTRPVSFYMLGYEDHPLFVLDVVVLSVAKKPLVGFDEKSVNPLVYNTAYEEEKALVRWRWAENKQTAARVVIS